MENLHEIPVKNGLIVKRISASKFEVYDASQPLSEKTEGEKPRQETMQSPATIARQSVIQRAPPAPRNDLNKVENVPPNKRRRTDNFTGDASSPDGVILIKDAIMYRIVDILMWKVMGENQLRNYGYPVASTCQVLWRIVSQSQNLGVRKTQAEYFNEDHDCGGNVACFANHVYQFLEMCAPNLWKRTGWGRLPVEELLRRIYYEDLIPYLRSVQLRNNINVLQCHSDIVLLEKWEKQKFTAVTWTGQKYFSQMSFNCPKCPQCSNRHF